MEEEIEIPPQVVSEGAGTRPPDIINPPELVAAPETPSAPASSADSEPDEGSIESPPKEIPQDTNPVPATITPKQARLILLNQGLLDTVEAMIAQQDRATQITWEFASEFRRDDPLLAALAVNLGLTNEQIDEFFIAAFKL